LDQTSGAARGEIAKLWLPERIWFGFLSSCPGFVPGIHVLWQRQQDVDGRDKPGHDEKRETGSARRALPPGTPGQATG
jgi:hypothetical protein